MRGLAIRTRGLVHIYHAEEHDVAALSGVDLDVVAGEMVDWEAPTGGYLLTACLATGRVAGQGAAAWVQARP